MKKALGYILFLILLSIIQNANAALKVTPTILELNANETRSNYITAAIEVQGDDNETIRFNIPFLF